MRLLAGLLALMLHLPCSAQALRAVTIVTGSTPGWADSAGAGFAPELLQAFASATQYRVNLEVFPLKRALAVYLNGPADCFIGGDAYSAKYAFPASTLNSKPIRKAGMVIYSSPSRPAVSNLQDVRSWRLGLERGFDYPAILTQLPKISSEPAAAEQQIRKIAIGRIDGYVGLFPPSRLNAELVHFNPNFLLLSYTDTLQCRPSSENMVLLAAFNQFLDQYRRSGQLDKLLGHYFVTQQTAR